MIYFQEQSRLDKELYAAYPQEVNVKHRLAIVFKYLGFTYTKMEQLDSVLIYYEQYSNLVKELHEAYPQNVSFKYELALSFQWLGWFYEESLNNPPNARGYYQRSKELLAELVLDFPQYAEI